MNQPGQYGTGSFAATDQPEICSFLCCVWCMHPVNVNQSANLEVYPVFLKGVTSKLVKCSSIYAIDLNILKNSVELCVMKWKLAF